MKKFTALIESLLMMGAVFGLVACSNAADNFTDNTISSSYSNEYLEIIVSKASARTVYYNSSEIAYFELIAKFNDSSVEDLSVKFNPTDTYSFNVFQDCSVTLEISGYNNDSKKIAYGSKAVDFTVGNDAIVIVSVNMLTKSSTITVKVEINENSSLAEQFVSTYGTGNFYDYWFSDLSLTSLEDYLNKGTDLAYYETDSGLKVMIDRPYGNNTVVSLDSNGNFWVFNTDDTECSVKIKVDDTDVTLSQGRYNYETLYIYDSNGWAHNTWEVSELE